MPLIWIGECFAGLANLLVGRSVRKRLKAVYIATLSGDAEAEFTMGMAYYKGEGVTRDYKISAEWLGLAAVQGHGAAQYHLGGMYSLGEGVTRDYNTAYGFLKMANANGVKKATEAMNDLEKKMISAQIEKAQTLSRECVGKEAEFHHN